MWKHPLDADSLQELLWSFAAHRTLTTAGRAGILRRLSAAPGTPAEVAADLDLDPLATGKVLRALTALGVLEASGERFIVQSGLAPRFAGGTNDLGPFLEHSHAMYERWGQNLESWLRGEPWSTAPRGPDDVARFAAAMQAMASVVADQVVGALDLEGAKRLLDLGGSTGAYARKYLDACPGLRATVVDVEPVAALGREMSRGTEYEGRLDFLGGDYLTADLGAGYDLAQIANVLHQEPEDRARSLVRRAADALAPGGRLVVVDFAIDEAKTENAVGALFAINMRSFGDTYSEPEIRSFMNAAGLGDVERIDLGRTRWIIAGRRPG